MFTGSQQVIGISPSYSYHIHLAKNDCPVNLARFDIAKFASPTVGVIPQPQLETLFFECLCLVKDGSSLGDHLKSKILIKDVSVGGSDHLLEYHVI